MSNLNLGVLSNLIILPQSINISQVLQVIDAATNLATIDQYNQQKPALQKADADLKTYLTRQDSQISSLTNQLTSAQTQIQTLTNANNDLNNQVAALNAQIAQLKAQVASAPKTALPLHVAQSFKNVVDQIQSDARNTPGVQTTITNMQIAVKALVNVQPGTGPNPTTDAVLVFPDASQPPDPNLLSTFTVNFGAIPNIRSAQTTPPASVTPAPAAPAAGGTQPPPAKRPASTKAAPEPAAEAPPQDTAAEKAQSFTDRLKEKIFGAKDQDTGSK
jgi:hypothetical protein